ncbi:MAG: UDP-glucose/GDP-mannose dehydrogenase family protein [Steroidobacteraceae bacterium]
MRVTVFGCGYVGLVTGACLADAGNHVICVDVDQARVTQLNVGDISIHEPGLDALVASNMRAARLEFTADVALGVAHGLIQVIAVGTPPLEDGSADIWHVLRVARSIGKHLDHYAVVITKSTVPVGTGDRVRDQINEELSRRNLKVEFDVVSNPEFLKEGSAVADFMRPDRIVIGTDSARAREVLQMLYEPFTRNRERVVAMDMRSAELTKYAANAMLATRISLMNELAGLAEQVGADIEMVRLGIGADPRIGSSFIYAGIGYGGSCFPKDIRALIRLLEVHGRPACILAAVDEVNRRQKTVLSRNIRRHYGDDLAGKTFALWGLAFKPNTSDMREAPSLVLIKELLRAGATVRAFDPVAGDEAIRVLGNPARFELSPDAEEALVGADALVIATEWRMFRSPDFERMKRALKAPIVFDGRNLYNPEVMQGLGFVYYGIGRGTTKVPNQ